MKHLDVETFSNLKLKGKSKPIFWNYALDKGKLKSFVSWFLKQHGEKKTLELLEQLKVLGFGYATEAGISLGIEDLKIPPTKMKMLAAAQHLVFGSKFLFKKGHITDIERTQGFMEVWNEVNETLKDEVVAHFRKTNILNPVYMMAFSGARGNLSQVRQLVGMRGLMSDPQGKIIDFPILSNFREGLTLTEYLISTYGARKGIVDTALRTATAGYLTRRLVDVAQHVVVSKMDCGTHRGIFLFDMKEGVKTIYSFQNRLLGRVLAQDVFEEEQAQGRREENSSSGNLSVVLKKMASRNQEIDARLAAGIAKVTKKALVRSPLTCENLKRVCQLCYGWSLATSRLVSIGEAVGVIAGQSIGEPGTQLTMRTFHTGGVFAGSISEQINAPFDCTVEYSNPMAGLLMRLSLAKNNGGTLAFFTKAGGSMILKPLNPGLGLKTKTYRLPPFTILFARHGENVTKTSILAQISEVTLGQRSTQITEQTVYAAFEGEVFYSQLDLMEEIDEKYGERVSSSEDWAKVWLLSGKVFQAPLRNKTSQSSSLKSYFPEVNDFISKKTVCQEIEWVNPMPSSNAARLGLPKTRGIALGNDVLFKGKQRQKSLKLKNGLNLNHGKSFKQKLKTMSNLLWGPFVLSDSLKMKTKAFETDSPQRTWKFYSHITNQETQTAYDTCTILSNYRVKASFLEARGFSPQPTFLDYSELENLNYPHLKLKQKVKIALKSLNKAQGFLPLLEPGTLKKWLKLYEIRQSKLNSGKQIKSQVKNSLDIRSVREITEIFEGLGKGKFAIFPMALKKKFLKENKSNFFWGFFLKEEIPFVLKVKTVKSFKQNVKQNFVFKRESPSFGQQLKTSFCLAEKETFKNQKFTNTELGAAMLKMKPVFVKQVQPEKSNPIGLQDLFLDQPLLNFPITSSSFRNLGYTGQAKISSSKNDVFLSYLSLNPHFGSSPLKAFDSFMTKTTGQNQSLNTNSWQQQPDAGLSWYPSQTFIPESFLCLVNSPLFNFSFFQQMLVHNKKNLKNVNLWKKKSLEILNLSQSAFSRNSNLSSLKFQSLKLHSFATPSLKNMSNRSFEKFDQKTRGKALSRLTNVCTKVNHKGQVDVSSNGYYPTEKTKVEGSFSFRLRQNFQNFRKTKMPRSFKHFKKQNEFLSVETSLYKKSELSLPQFGQKNSPLLLTKTETLKLRQPSDQRTWKAKRTVKKKAKVLKSKKQGYKNDQFTHLKTLFKQNQKPDVCFSEVFYLPQQTYNLQSWKATSVSRTLISRSVNKQSFSSSQRKFPGGSFPRKTTFYYNPNHSNLNSLGFNKLPFNFFLTNAQGSKKEFVLPGEGIVRLKNVLKAKKYGRFNSNRVAVSTPKHSNSRSVSSLRSRSAGSEVSRTNEEQGKLKFGKSQKRRKGRISHLKYPFFLNFEKPKMFKNKTEKFPDLFSSASESRKRSGKTVETISRETSETLKHDFLNYLKKKAKVRVVSKKSQSQKNDQKSQNFKLKSKTGNLMIPPNLTKYFTYLPLMRKTPAVKTNSSGNKKTVHKLDSWEVLFKQGWVYVSSNLEAENCQLGKKRLKQLGETIIDDIFMENSKVLIEPLVLAEAQSARGQLSNERGEEKNQTPDFVPTKWLRNKKCRFFQVPEQAPDIKRLTPVPRMPVEKENLEHEKASQKNDVLKNGNTQSLKLSDSNLSLNMEKMQRLKPELRYLLRPFKSKILQNKSSMKTALYEKMQQNKIYFSGASYHFYRKYNFKDLNPQEVPSEFLSHVPKLEVSVEEMDVFQKPTLSRWFNFFKKLKRKTQTKKPKNNKKNLKTKYSSNLTKKREKTKKPRSSRNKKLHNAVFKFFGFTKSFKKRKKHALSSPSALVFTKKLRTHPVQNLKATMLKMTNVFKPQVQAKTKNLKARSRKLVVNNQSHEGLRVQSWFKLFKQIHSPVYFSSQGVNVNPFQLSCKLPKSSWQAYSVPILSFQGYKNAFLELSLQKMQNQRFVQTSLTFMLNRSQTQNQSTSKHQAGYGLEPLGGKMTETSPYTEPSKKSGSRTVLWNYFPMLQGGPQLEFRLNLHYQFLLNSKFRPVGSWKEAFTESTWVQSSLNKFKFKNENFRVQRFLKRKTDTSLAVFQYTPRLQNFLNFNNPMVQQGQPVGFTRFYSSHEGLVLKDYALESNLYLLKRTSNINLDMPILYDRQDQKLILTKDDLFSLDFVSNEAKELASSEPQNILSKRSSLRNKEGSGLTKLQKQTKFENLSQKQAFFDQGVTQNALKKLFEKHAKFSQIEKGYLDKWAAETPGYEVSNFTTVYEQKSYTLSKMHFGFVQTQPLARIGKFFHAGDSFYGDMCLSQGGQVVHINGNKVTFRKAQYFLLSPKAILHSYHGQTVQAREPVMTLPFETLKTGDIVQGIPKVEQYLEARTTIQGRLFLNSLPVLLYAIYRRYLDTLEMDKAARQSFLKIQQILVDGVQRVYRSQGVGITDKHLEVVVRQMTSKVKIIYGGQTGFFPGELVDVDLIERINQTLRVKVVYEPVVLGITRASLEVNSFLSAASFQQTTKVLTRAALENKRDFLKGLKENLLVGNLLPAGTGYVVPLA